MFMFQHVILWSCAIQCALRLVDFAQVPDNIKENTFAVIAVLSAQDNFEARNNIRNTWKSLTNRPDLQFYFLIGKNICQIHPFDRKTELSCDAFQFPDTVSREPAWTPAIPEYFDSVIYKSGVSSFTFHINYPIIIRGVRLWKQSFQGSTVAVVNLKNARTGHLVTSVLFNTTDSAYNDSMWLEIETDPYLLPKSFDAVVQIDFQNIKGISVSCYGVSDWVDFSGAIQFTSQFHADAGWINFHNKTCSPISLLLELNEIDKHVRTKDYRSLLWQRHMETLTQTLDHEAATEKDIIFLDVVDVYRNIPQKLLQFYKWATQNLAFTYLLKADDDTFIDVPRVIKFLKSIPNNDISQMWWWGKLRHGLPVERHGKWQELDYAAPIYPPFLCGGGYVINKVIVEYLVTNLRWLYPFQGEDTSLGIWLSGVHPVSPQNASCHWSCSTECDQSSCNRCQLSTEDILSVWKKFKGNSTIC